MRYLARLYTVSWKCSYFPDKWKSGITVLIPKPGKDPTSAKNYRPITLLAAPGKTYERIIEAELTNYLEASNILPDTQAGFRGHRSTQDKLFELVQDAKSRFFQEQTTVACFFDIEKAFDKMSHEEFALKLDTAGIPIDTIGLLINYLSGRTIRLRVNGTLSESIHLKAGTPQGAILSPTLFGIWVSDLPKPSINVSVSQFADDTATWSSHRDMKEAQWQLQQYNNKVMEWCRKWKILLSPQKTQVIAFSKDTIAHPESVYQMINGKRIVGNSSAVFLGVVLDANLTLVKHHDKITKELRRRVGLLRGITGTPSKPRAPSDIGRKIVQSMIEPVCSYASTVTIVRNETMFREQDRLLAKAYKLALHCPNTCSSDYIRDIVGLRPTRETTEKQARDYIYSPFQSSAFKNILKSLDARSRRRSTNKKLITPLHVLK